MCASAGVVEDEFPEQIAARVIAETEGFGLTVTETVNGAPVHDPKAGVTV